jgi:hypothetical protein
MAERGVAQEKSHHSGVRPSRTEIKSPAFLPTFEVAFFACHTGYSKRKSCGQHKNNFKAFFLI